MRQTKNISAFERDFIRLMYSNGESDARIADMLGRARSAVHRVRRSMIRDGSINQLPLPGFEQRPDQIEGAMSDER